MIDPDQPQVYYLDEEYQQFFEMEIIDWLRKRTDFTDESGLTFERFKEIQNAKEEAGILAEEYVMSFVNGHPFLSHIKRISKKVEAGYDIVSFNSLISKELDRFIEVKSFARNPEFYWSKNEVQTAEIKGSRYFLYLVDRTRIDITDYEPQIIQDPYMNVFESSKWNKKP